TRVDTLKAGTDSLALDSLGAPADTIRQEQPDGLKAVVTIVAQDSQVTDIRHNIIHIYKEAKIKYEGFELAADYIRINNNTNEIFASGVFDHNNKYVGRPVVIFPNETPKVVDSLRYNFKSEKGDTWGIFTEVEGGFIQA